MGGLTQCVWSETAVEWLAFIRESILIALLLKAKSPL